MKLFGKELKFNNNKVYHEGNKPIASDIFLGNGETVEDKLSNLKATVKWQDVEDKPDAFPSSRHTHSWEDVNDKPETFPSSYHTHSWENVEGKPSTFPATYHTHSWDEVLSKPSISKSLESYSITLNDIYGNQASGMYSTAEGSKTIASGKYSHAEGRNSKAEGEGSHAEGWATATGDYSHAESWSTATGSYSHAEGMSCMAEGSCSHAEGYQCTASASYSHAGGSRSSASGKYSQSHGYWAVANGMYQTAIGAFNNRDGETASISETNSLFIIGNGATLAETSNAFRVTYNGNVFGGTYNTSGADYAEMFEWTDGNPKNEDRVGYFVTFDSKTEKIRKANSNDDYILGIISTGTAILGDNYDEEWKNKYLRNEWGKKLYETKTFTSEDNESYTQEVPIINSDYNPNFKYIPRSQRKEWSPVGLLGKLLVYDDGTCNPGDFCMPNDNGIATKAKNGYYVMSRENDNIIKVLFK